MSQRTDLTPQRNPAAAPARSAAARPAMVEHLEPRRFLSAALKVDNLDVLPGFERMIFNRIRNINVDKPNYVKDRGTLRLTNTGDQTLRFGTAKIVGPFQILGMAPLAIPAGKSVTVTVLFTATAPPKFTYNQTNSTTNARDAGAYIGSMSFATNDPANPTYTEELAGWFQNDSERNEEPNLQTQVNLLANFKTQIAAGQTVTLGQPATSAQYYGEEVVSAYWTAANASKSVGVRQLSKFRSQGDITRFAYFLKSDKVVHNVLASAGLAGQSFLPYKDASPTTTAAATTFSVGSAPFGFKIDSEYSVDSLNANQNGGGHTLRFFPVRDHLGNLLDNTYFVCMDYSVDPKSQNFDFQDNVFILTNIKPAGN
ncbi:MAG: hypothetical protein JWO31_3091 [Phycisphaerales bacterium]|nr:hypothetical protein [Phycisphaerales bacterium]